MNKPTIFTRIGMWYASGTPKKSKSFTRYEVIADDCRGTCTVRDAGGVEYPVASYLIDEIANPAVTHRA
jgi:hypothetical protein